MSAAAVAEQPVLLEAEGVDRAQMGRVHVCTREAQVLLHLCRPGPRTRPDGARRRLSATSRMRSVCSLPGGARNHADGLRGLAGEIAPGTR